MTRTIFPPGAIASGVRQGALILVLGCGFSACSTDVVEPVDAESMPATAPTSSPRAPRAAEQGEVVAVIDGDTIDVLLDGVVERVRFIGINSPEGGECFAEEATDAVTLLIGGRSVRLETDTSDRDQFGRLLRYVFVDDVLINENLVANGLAIARRYEPDTALADFFEAAQERAQADGVGLWAEDACGQSVADLEVLIAEIEFDAPGDDGENLNGEWIVLLNQSAEPVDMTGWVLKDESASHRFSFPTGFLLQPDQSVHVFSGCGTNTARELFWCISGSAIWNNSGDTVFVLDANGTIVTSESY